MLMFRVRNVMSIMFSRVWIPPARPVMAIRVGIKVHSVWIAPRVIQPLVGAMHNLLAVTPPLEKKVALIMAVQVARPVIPSMYIAQRVLPVIAVTLGQAVKEGKAATIDLA